VSGGVPFEAFVRSRTGALLAFAHALTGDAVLAEELTQEALVRTGMAWWRIKRDPDPYTRTIIVRQYLREQRSRRREAPTDPGHAAPANVDVATAVAERVDLTRALAQLPPGQRAIVVLRHYADYSEADVAATLGCSVGTVKSQAHRALRQLRLALDGQPSAKDHR
jgi:RNA polymerase sigma-70 factor (sigma-E family)